MVTKENKVTKETTPDFKALADDLIFQISLKSSLQV